MEEFFSKKQLDTSKAFLYLNSLKICGGIGPTRNDEERDGTSESCQEQKHADEIILEEKLTIMSHCMSMLMKSGLRNICYHLALGHHP